jgi:hypothetical protein
LISAISVASRDGFLETGGAGLTATEAGADTVAVAVAAAGVAGAAFPVAVPGAVETAGFASAMGIDPINANINANANAETGAETNGPDL